MPANFEVFADLAFARRLFISWVDTPEERRAWWEILGFFLRRGGPPLSFLYFLYQYIDVEAILQIVRLLAPLYR